MVAISIAPRADRRRAFAKVALMVAVVLIGVFVHMATNFGSIPNPRILRLPLQSIEVTTTTIRS